MTQQLEPEKADVSDVPEWIRQAHALICRRWLVFAALGLLHIVISAMTLRMGYLTMPLGYIVSLCFLMVFILLAKSSDDSIALSFVALVKMLQRCIVSLIILSVLISLVTVAAEFLGSWLMPNMQEGSILSSGPPSPLLRLFSEWLAPGVMRFFVIYLSITISGMWFLLPLLVFNSLNVLESAVLSRRAERINVMVIISLAYLPLFGLIFLLLLHEISYIVTSVLVPYFGAIQYVSYRHVFTQKKQNSPARAVAAALQSQIA